MISTHPFRAFASVEMHKPRNDVTNPKQGYAVLREVEAAANPGKLIIKSIMMFRGLTCTDH